MAKLSKKARWKLLLEANEGERFYRWRCGGKHHDTIILNACVRSALCPDGHLYTKQEEVSQGVAFAPDYAIIFGKAQ